MRIHLIRETWSHMAEFSGFDPLFAKLQNRVDWKAESSFIPKALKFRKLLYRVLAKLGVSQCKQTMLSQVSPFIEFEPSLIAARAVALLQSRPDEILLLSLGESQYASVLTTAPKDIRKRIFLCLHQPPAWLRLFWRDFKVLDGLGGIFVLCHEQGQFIREQCQSPVHVIRHGVSLDHFKPGPSNDHDKPRFLFVGQWLRDFDTLAIVIPLILAKHPEARFDLVVPDMARYKERLYSSLYAIARHPEVRWHIGVSSEALRDLYRNARALLLPLMDSTANNAIGEAMACGIPVITTDVGGVRDYLTADAGIFCPLGDAQSYADAAIALLSSLTQARIMGEAARSQAEKTLCWDMIAEQVATIIQGKAAPSIQENV